MLRYPTPANYGMNYLSRENSLPVAEFEDQQPIQRSQGTCPGALPLLYPPTKAPRSLLKTEQKLIRAAEALLGTRQIQGRKGSALQGSKERGKCRNVLLIQEVWRVSARQDRGWAKCGLNAERGLEGFWVPLQVKREFLLSPPRFKARWRP